MSFDGTHSIAPMVTQEEINNLIRQVAGLEAQLSQHKPPTLSKIQSDLIVAQQEKHALQDEIRMLKRERNNLQKRRPSIVFKQPIKEKASDEEYTAKKWNRQSCAY